ncbi:Hypothetical predicted protein [Pelobates cultripes]|uniref:Uncharacterized protein n=1 Tax=Pelobates cultripes TaxID=61616 RepID=A0AAD1RC66_PELCU|nr:Hypothetical predicted protein [Pelobates cultripes]
MWHSQDAKLWQKADVASPPELQVQPALNDMPEAVKDAAIPPRNIAPGRAKSTRTWKRACAHEDSSDLDWSLEEQYDDSYMDHYSVEYSDSGSEIKVFIATQEVTAQGTMPAESGEGDDLRDPLGNPLCDPDDLRHPRLAEWEPPAHIAKYLALRVRKPLSKEGHNKLRRNAHGPSSQTQWEKHLTWTLNWSNS